MAVGLCLALIVGFIGATPVPGEASPRLSRAPSQASPVPLPGSTAPVPPGASPLGPATPTAVLPFQVALASRDPAGLAAAVAGVSTPGSPMYRHFLPRGAFAQLYGATPGAIAAVTGVLRAFGFSVGPASSLGLALPVTATVGQVESAFSVAIDTYRLPSGAVGYHNEGPPSLPASVLPDVQGIVGLDTLSPPQPASVPAPPRPGGPAGLSPTTAPTVTPAGSPAPGQPFPQPGACASNINVAKTGYGAWTADDLAQAYSFDPLYQAGQFGAGQTVGIVEFDNTYPAGDITTFAGCYGISLGPSQITNINVDGGPTGTGGATVEIDLDIETMLSLAPQANINVYQGTNSMFDVLSRIESDDTAKIVSISWTEGCDANISSSYRSSETTLLDAAALQGQSIVASSGDEGSEGCNTNGLSGFTTGSGPVAQVIDPSTSSIYVANSGANAVEVGSESPATFATANTQSNPQAIVLDSAAGDVVTANQGSSSLTVLHTATCNASITTGCSSPGTVTSGTLSGPDALGINPSTATLYVANATNHTVALFNATTLAASGAAVTLPAGTAPSAVAVNPATDTIFVADRANGLVDWFSGASCNATTTSGCSSATVHTVTVGTSPSSMVVDTAAGANSLYVADAGSGGGIAVINLATDAPSTTISTTNIGAFNQESGQPASVALSPLGGQVLALIDGLSYPGDALATINPASQSIVALAGLHVGGDTLGALATDATLGLAWMTDQTANEDLVQNLKPGADGPADQPDVTGVGGTSLSALGPAPTETVWNRALSGGGAGGGGISSAFVMPSYQQPVGVVAGSSGTPCGNASGDCREVPDVSADADPFDGYIIYDSVNAPTGWFAQGGTSAAAPLWAGVLAVAGSADAVHGFGLINPTLYTLAQHHPGTYLNDVTSGNNDYNQVNGGTYPAMGGYDMATGLGSPIVSALAVGLSGVSQGAPSPLTGGNAYSMVLDPTGTVWDWGTQTPQGVSSARPVQVAGLPTITAISGGANDALAVDTSGNVWSFGYNYFDALGTSAGFLFSPPTKVPGVTNTVAVAAGGTVSLALRADGSVLGWGIYNGAGSSSPSPTPAVVVNTTGTALSGITSVASGGGGGSIGMALRNDGTVWSWGTSDPGDGSPSSTRAVQVQKAAGGALTGIVAIAAGVEEHYALDSSGSVWAWGADITGNGTAAASPKAVQVDNPTGTGTLTGIVSISSNTWTAHAVGSNGDVYSWGNGSEGELGTGAEETGPDCCPIEALLPVIASGPATNLAVGGGATTTLALQLNGTVESYGSDAYAQLGRTAPLQPAGTPAQDAFPGVVPGVPPL